MTTEFRRWFWTDEPELMEGVSGRQGGTLTLVDKKLCLNGKLARVEIEDSDKGGSLKLVGLNPGVRIMRGSPEVIIRGPITFVLALSHPLANLRVSREREISAQLVDRRSKAKAKFLQVTDRKRVERFGILYYQDEDQRERFFSNP